MSTSRPTPSRTATYRLQLAPEFGFDAALERIPSLAAVGFSHVYLSPIAEAVPGSGHGYDVVDHTAVRAELGGAEALERLLDAAAAAGIGVLVDHVPNHASVAVPQLNRPWSTMLRDGPASGAARWFDVDWEAGGGRVVLPVLGAPLDEVVAAGDLALDTDGGSAVLRYHDSLFPLAPGTDGDDLDDVLARQHYELIWWRDPRRNVRRFFTIDDLVAVRVEEPDVAHDVDTLLRLLVGHPAFAGVRIDHVDGLADPTSYLHGVRDLIGDRWLLVEKILAADETLPAGWPVDGTTGYEHVTLAEHLLLDPAGAGPMTALWASTGRPTDFTAVEHRARREVLHGGLDPDADRLVRTVSAALAGEPGDADRRAWRDAVDELTLGLDRYRTYLPDDPASEAVLDAAAERAGAARPDLADLVTRLVDLVRRDPTVRTRWQQLTGPVMAKGAEDRAFYRFTPLASLSEVGGEPGTWTIPPARFHDHQRRVAADWPTTLTASTTHDTKRSAAVRARSLALAAAAHEWARDVEAALAALGAVDGEVARDDGAAELAPVGVLDRADVLLALQTVVTAAPIGAERLGEYLVKSAREAELHTAWAEPDGDYEAALRSLARQLAAGAAVIDDGMVDDGTTDDGTSERWRWLAGWARRLVRSGATVGLRSLTLQLTVPGVPDLYQGAPAELTSLVDPDNRRRPDWEAWEDLVDATADDDPVVAWRRGEVGAARTALITRLLALRARRPDVFGPGGGYVPLDVHPAGEGDVDHGVVAFARSGPDGPVVVTVVAPWRAGGDPDVEVMLPPGTWRSVVPVAAPVVEGRLVTREWWTGPTAGLGLAVLSRIGT